MVKEMVLKTSIDYDGSEHEIDLDELENHGQYYFERQKGIVIRANVYTHGTPDSRRIRDEVITGRDYVIVPVDIDRTKLRTRIGEIPGIDVMDEELDEVVEEYSNMSVEIISEFAETLDGDRILRKEKDGVISTDIEQPYLGWEDVFETIVDRETEDTADAYRREIVQCLFNALRESSPGKGEYSAKIRIKGF